MGNCDFCSGTGEVVGVVGMVSLQFGLFEDEEEAVHTRGRTREEDLQREGTRRRCPAPGSSVARSS
jgi:hypothetical protein